MIEMVINTPAEERETGIYFNSMRTSFHCGFISTGLSLSPQV